MDLYSIKDDIIEPLTWKLIPTGLACELPEGTEGQVRSKSGIALKNGVFVLNTPGTVDENYRGEIGVVLYNLNTKEPFVIKKGQIYKPLTVGNARFIKRCSAGNTNFRRRIAHDTLYTNIRIKRSLSDGINSAPILICSRIKAQKSTDSADRKPLKSLRPCAADAL